MHPVSIEQVWRVEREFRQHIMCRSSITRTQVMASLSTHLPPLHHQYISLQQHYYATRLCRMRLKREVFRTLLSFLPVLYLFAFVDLISLVGAGRMSLRQDNDLFSLSIFFFHIHCDLKTKLAMHF